MQRSSVLARAGALALAWLLVCAISLPAHAQGTSAPMTLSASVARSSGELTYVPVTSVAPGDEIVYFVHLSPGYDPSQPLIYADTPITLTLQFDARLKALSTGSDGVCFGGTPMQCRDPFDGTLYVRQLSSVWVWFSVQPSNDRSPLKMRATSINGAVSIDTPYANSYIKFVPIVQR